MKKVIIIVLAVLIALTGGVLIYGAIGGAPEEYRQVTKGLLAEPPANADQGAAHWYDVSTILSSSATSKEKAANLLVYTAYNHINANQFYFAAHVDVRSGNKYTCSDYYRTQQGANAFYEALAYTGSVNTGKRRIDYNNQRLEDMTMKVAYDRKEKTYLPSWNPPSVSDRTSALPAETPYIIYSWFDLPIDMGSKNNAYNEIDSSLIDTVVIENPTSKKPYYSLTFTADLNKLNESKESVRRLNEGTGDAMKNIDVLDLSFTAEIWPSGLFRSITVHARVWASVSGKGAGEATIDRTYQFSYDEIDCSIAKKFEISGLTQYLNDQNKEKVAAELAALPVEEEEKKTEN